MPSRLIDVILSPPVHLASAETPGVGLGPPPGATGGLSSPPHATSTAVRAASARPGSTKRTRGGLLIVEVGTLSCAVCVQCYLTRAQRVLSRAASIRGAELP